MIIFALIVSLALMMYLINKKLPMGISIITGAVVLALLSGFSLSALLEVFLKALTARATLELVLIVYLIGLLGSMMQGYGIMDKMMEYLGKTFKSVKLLLFIIPSLLATFSVAGSAVFAAPVIDVLGDKVNITRERKAAINLYVRHAWYFVLPITASILYAAFLAEVSVWELIYVQAPVSLVCLLAAYFVYIAPLEDVKIEEAESTENQSLLLFHTIIYTSPLLVTILLVIFLPFYVALFVGCLLCFVIKVSKGDFFKMMKNRQGLNMVMAVAAIMVFKEVIGRIPAISILIHDVISRGVPLEVIVLGLPLVMGYILANPQALIGMLFPILLPLVPQEQVLATAAVINVLGFVTYFISPLHLCQALTNEYFEVQIKDLYKEYKITVPLMLISGIVNYFFIR